MKAAARHPDLVRRACVARIVGEVGGQPAREYDLLDRALRQALRVWGNRTEDQFAQSRFLSIRPAFTWAIRAAWLASHPGR